VFLHEHHLPLKIYISEDATGCAPRVQYHPGTNQLVGLSLPLNENGLPIVGSFPATTAKTISNHFKSNDVSKNAYCIVAQSIAVNSPSFVVAVYGTNNSFRAKDIHHRWHWLHNQFEEEGIE
ncbi:hypothetical protein FOCC_FOCC006590, partial [Frankliniella occidentalis]